MEPNNGKELTFNCTYCNKEITATIKSKVKEIGETMTTIHDETKATKMVECPDCWSLYFYDLELEVFINLTE